MIIWYGEAGTAKLLILSQVVFGIALPFFIIPLVMFTATAQDGCTRGADLGHIAGPLTAALLIALNFKLLADQLFG